ncbi:MAG: hypothetical protein KJO98_00475 [Rhodothermia bacterium]|nr:hypothetical protein [Rhodothermia bacterium]
MKSLRYRQSLSLGLLAMLLAVLAAQPAMAQDDEPRKVEKEIKVLVDDEGNITINGEPVSGDRMEMEDGTVVMVDEDGKVVVMGDDSDGHRVIRKKMMHPGHGERVNVFRMRDMDDAFEWKELGHDAHEAMEHARRMRFEGMLGEDFEFDFDFDHVNPEIMEMEAATRKLAREASRAEGNAKADKVRELEERLTELFARKLEMREKHVARLQERLEKERTALEQRRAERERIIERRKADLLGDDALKW